MNNAQNLDAKIRFCTDRLALLGYIALSGPKAPHENSHGQLVLEMILHGIDNWGKPPAPGAHGVGYV